MPASLAESPSRPSPLRGHWLWSTLLVAIGVLLMLRLGAWQLQRLQQRQEANAELLARLSQPPVTLTGQAVNAEQLDLRRAVVRGAYDFDQEIVLRNQQLGGAPGFHVITPLRIAGSQAAVLVDRGWIPYTQADPQARAAFHQPAGQVEVRGIARRSEVRSNSLSPADPQPAGPGDRADAWFRVAIPSIQKQVPYDLLPVYIQEGEPGDSAPVLGSSRLPVPYVEIDLSEGPHLGYAIQWFAFAAILLGGYVLLYRQRTGEGWEPEPEQDAHQLDKTRHES